MSDYVTVQGQMVLYPVRSGMRPGFHSLHTISQTSAAKLAASSQFESSLVSTDDALLTQCLYTYRLQCVMQPYGTQQDTLVQNNCCTTSSCCVVILYQ